jgi:lysophospholipase L1-like esterase
MAKWDWLEKAAAGYTWGFVLRVIVKAALLFMLLNVLFVLLDPVPAIGRLSLYNVVVPGRERLPYGENPALSYNLSPFELSTMFATHEVTRPKSDDEFRVLLFGDSATWGWLQAPDETIAAHFNALDLRTDDDQRVVAYNLGYPVMSLTKDLILVDAAMRYDPDLIVWAFTLESFPREKQVFPPLVQHNPARVRDLIARYDLNLDPDDPRFVESSLWDRTLVGQRRELANWFRLQAYGFAWAATGIDQHLPADYELRASDFDADITWEGFTEPQALTGEELAFDVLAAGIERAGAVPVLLVNEPMFISEGENSDLRYNFFYPRWAYDSYHEALLAIADHEGWHLLDLWDALPPEAFTDSPVHTTPTGAQIVAERLAQALQQRDFAVRR